MDQAGALAWSDDEEDAPVSMHDMPACEQLAREHRVSSDRVRHLVRKFGPSTSSVRAALSRGEE